MEKGQTVRIAGAAGISSHFGIVVDTIADGQAAFLKVPCKSDRDKAPAGLILLGEYYFTKI